MTFILVHWYKVLFIVHWNSVYVELKRESKFWIIIWQSFLDESDFSAHEL